MSVCWVNKKIGDLPERGRRDPLPCSGVGLHTLLPSGSDGRQRLKRCCQHAPRRKTQGGIKWERALGVSTAAYVIFHIRRMSGQSTGVGRGIQRSKGLDELFLTSCYTYQLNDTRTLNYKMHERENVRDLGDIFAWLECYYCNYRSLNFKKMNTAPVCCCLNN